MIISINPDNFRHNTTTLTKTVDLYSCETDEKVFKAFAVGLDFPDWFGYNWAAFHDCMLNLCFDVDNTLVVELLNCDKCFESNQVNLKCLLQDINAMVSGKATQDDGTQIDVVFNLYFNEKQTMEYSKIQIEKQLSGNLSLSIAD